MKYVYWLTLIFLGITAEAKEGPKPGKFSYSLKSHEGKKNLLVIFAVEEKDPRFKKTLEGVLGRYADFRKKELGLYYVFETQGGRADDLKLRPSDAQDLRKLYKIANGEFKILLIDKSGKIKKQSSEPMTKDQLNQFLGIES